MLLETYIWLFLHLAVLMDILPPAEFHLPRQLHRYAVTSVRSLHLRDHDAVIITSDHYSVIIKSESLQLMTILSSKLDAR